MLPDTLRAERLFEESHRCRLVEGDPGKPGMGTGHRRRDPGVMARAAPIYLGGAVRITYVKQPMKAPGTVQPLASAQQLGSAAALVMIGRRGLGVLRATHPQNGHSETLEVCAEVDSSHP